MNGLKSRRKLLLFTSAALLFVTVLMSVFGYLMYRKHLYSVYANLSKVHLTNTTENISYGVSFGKSIEKYYGMTQLLDDAKESSPLLEDLYILDAEGRTLYTTTGAQMHEGISVQKANQTVILDGKLYSSIALSEGAIMIAQMDASNVSQALNRFAHALIRTAILIYASAAVLFVLIYSLTARKSDSVSKKLMLFVMIIAIISLGVYVGYTCWNEYESSYRLLADGVSHALRQDLSKLMSAGIGYDELYGMDEYLKTYASAIPEFSAIELSQTAEEVSPGDFAAFFDLEDASSLHSFRVDFTVSSSHRQSALLQYALNTILLSMVALLIITEYSMFSAETPESNSVMTDEERSHLNMSRMIRVFYFILYACLKIGMSLDAIVARELSRTMGAASSALTGLPTTTAMVGALCSVVFSPVLIRRLKGLKAPLFVSAFASVSGLLVCAFTSNIYTFAAARFMTGFGEGLAAMLLKNIAAIQLTGERRKSFLAMASGGTFAGMCMGSVMGGMLNDQLSRTYVYLIGAVVLLSAITLIFFIHLPKTDASGEKSSVFKGIVRVFTHLPALRYLISIVIPVYVCAVFLDYVLPLAGSDFGFSTTLISTLILAYSLIAGYASPALTRLAGKVFPTASAAAIAYSALTGLVIVLYPIFNSALFLVIAIVMMGVCDSFGVVYLNEGFIMAGKDASYDKNIGNTAFTMTCKGGSMVAPYIIAFTGSYMALPATVAIGLIVYAVSGGIMKKRQRQTV